MRGFRFGYTFFLLSIFLPAAAVVEARIRTDLFMPVLPIIAEYEYAPVYLAQDIGGHDKYEEIIAVFDPNDASTVEVILIEKATNKRIYYCNSELNALKRRMQGEEPILTKIDFKRSESDEGLPIYGFGFKGKDGQPILWRVIPTGTPSVRGAGINDVRSENLRVEYRDIGTTIGDGTALKIGGKIFEAKPWPQISSPPYFYAYHGTFTIGRHMGMIRTGNEKWTVISRPEKLSKGGKWVLSNGSGYKRNLKIISNHRDELVIDEINPAAASPSTIRIVVHTTASGYNLRSVKLRARFEGEKEMKIKFEPELPVLTSDSADFEGKFFIDQGGNKNVVVGNITRKTISGEIMRLKWLPTSPSWAKSKALETVIGVDAAGYSISASRTLPETAKLK
ncbi:MAG: hypothetical protein HKN25_03650 [Pyrinomonadaceae bacterium]|nr:hypothetical protein [Pyrinomonadaceae bacterium]